METENAATRGSSASTSRSTFDIAAVSLPGSWDPVIPIAATRAGHLGLLDLSCHPDPSLVEKALDQLLSRGNRRIGVILDGRKGKAISAILERLPPQATVLFRPCAGNGLKSLVADAHSRVRTTGVIVTSMRQLQSLDTPEIDIVVAKGHEAGGIVGENTTYVLMQELLSTVDIPVYAWGGIGVRSAAACRVAGAAGALIDWQLATLRESPLSAGMKRRIRRMDGSETRAVHFGEGVCFRYWSPPGSTSAQRLQAFAEAGGVGADAAEVRLDSALRELWEENPAAEAWCPMGQDVCLAEQTGTLPTVGRFLSRFRAQIDTQFKEILQTEALTTGSALARFHRTTYPVVQGPMTRVSDVPAFCDAVEKGGGLPFLALALIRGPHVRQILETTRDLMGDRSWGVGILGFVPKALRDEQMAVVEEIRPPFAIIAGGRPDQTASLEKLGINTYLHVPSPVMLEMFIKEGARRFIFEGQECGGHIGPRSSFVLWESMIQVMLDVNLTREEASKVCILFAGGIHDARSAAMAAAMAQPLLNLGMKFGVLMGTAYLFTKEAVETGAIVPRFQQVSLEAGNTVLVETGPGHAIRCAPTEFYTAFCEEKRRLRREGIGGAEIRETLERANSGRLRIASKAVARSADREEEGEVRYVTVDEERQRRDGMYMIGQVASMHGTVSTIAELHQRVCEGAVSLIERRAEEPQITVQSDRPSPKPMDVAVVGMSCLLPGGATNVDRYWENILEGRDCIEEVPPDRWDVNLWYDEDRSARDRIYSKWGGFLEDLPFDPLKYGIPPAALQSIEPMQLLGLELVDQALRHAGYHQDNPYRERTSVILGAGGGAADLGGRYAFRAMLPGLAKSVDPELLDKYLPEWTEDSFAGILVNVIAGRISNRFDLGGCNFTIDAACASSLAAIYLGSRELMNGSCDMVIAGGCDTIQNPFGYLCFSKTGALSPGGRSRPFDADADGIAISEGHAAVVLKRLDDAERDGDTVYAVIRGAGGGSDGRHLGLTAPRVEGQLRALDRAYDQAGFTPDTVGIFEAHGTGTAVGDAAECTALHRLLAAHHARPHSVAIGGVKSMIGHTKCAAGVAGLIKMALSLHHKVLPPTLHVNTPNPKAGFGEGALYVNSELRPWIRRDHPRRAAVSAFGFGGSNFHAVLEEYGRESMPRLQAGLRKRRAAELFFFSGETRAAAVEAIRAFGEEVRQSMAAGAELDLADVAYTHFERQPAVAGPFRSALLVRSLEELIDTAVTLSGELPPSGRSPKGVYLPGDPRTTSGLTAFFFPGQGSQYPNMLRSLAVEFREVAECFDRADQVLRDQFDRPLSEYIFPPPMFSDEARDAVEQELKQTQFTQPALGVCDVAMMKLLAAFGIRPDMTAGQSYGEVPALYAAGCITEEQLYELSAARGRAIVDTLRLRNTTDLGMMLAVAADYETIEPLTHDRANVWLANQNSPRQIVLSGTTEGIQEVRKALQQQDIACQIVPVGCAFHSPIMAPARSEFLDTLKGMTFQPAVIPVYSNATAATYPREPDAICQHLADQLTSQVRWREEVLAMQKDGATAFIEVGPNRVLSRFISQTLAEVPHLSVSTNGNGKHLDAVIDFLDALATLYTHGMDVDLTRLYLGRQVCTIELDPQRIEPPQKNTSRLYTLNGSRVRPASEPPPATAPAFRIVSAQDAEENLSSTPHRSQSESGGSEAPTPTPAPYVPPATSQPPAHPVPPNDDAFAQFQETMRKFLETQRTVMNAYLGGAPIPSDATASTVLSDSVAAPTPAPAPVAPTPPEAGPEDPPVRAPEPAVAPRERLAERLVAIVSERTGYPADMLDSRSHLEADLGIDSIKRVEIIAAFRNEVIPEMEEPPSWFMEQMAEASTMEEILDGVSSLVGEPAHAAGAAAPAPATGPEIDLQSVLTQIVAERTGYPEDMLDPTAHLEADLGIDSIKRVEIIAAFRRRVIPRLEQPPAWFMDGITKATTLREVLAGMEKLVAETESGSAPPPAAGVPDTAPLDASAYRENLVRTISERTGYPADMLEETAHLEADLGIDSIKRVEIIAAFRRQVMPDMEEPSSDYMDRMTHATSIREIVEIMTAFSKIPAVRHAVEETVPAALQAKTSAVEEGLACPRCVVQAVDAPLQSNGGFTAPRGTVVVTRDSQGLAEKLVQRIEGLGGHAVSVDPDDLQGVEQALTIVQRIRDEGRPIAGLVHLAPISEIGEEPPFETTRWRNHIQQEVKTLLFLLQACALELEGTGDRRLRVFCYTRGGGDFLTEDGMDAIHPWRAGIAGLMKVAAKEWNHACFRAIDVTEVPDVALILQEWSSLSSPLEIGYRYGRRLALRAVRREIPAGNHSQTAHMLDSQDVVVVTGGARGITAQVVEEMAGHCRATFVLLGRSTLPKAVEDGSTAAITDVIKLRRAVSARLREAGETLTPRAVEAEVRRLLAAREIRNTSKAIEQAGGRSEYISCDVRNPELLAEKIKDVEARHGRVNAVIHGAGIIEDKRIVDKSVESFDRVVGTKLEPMLTLCRCLDVERLKLVVFFSSTAGFFGNAGQVDYAAANEMLNRLARHLQNLGVAKVVSLNWGPWSGVGMVTPEVAEQFEARGVGLVPSAAGRAAAWREIIHNPADGVRILLGPGSWVDSMHDATPTAMLAPETPLLAKHVITARADQSIEASVELNAEVHRYLRDHRIEEQPVLPLTVALEMMSELAAAARPDLQVVRVEDVHQLKGIVLDSGPHRILLRAHPVETDSDRAMWRVSISDPSTHQRKQYQCLIRMATALPPAPAAPFLEPIEGRFPLSVEEAYHQWLFHGPTYQIITRLEGLSSAGIDALVKPSDVGPAVGGLHSSSWLIDPIVLDVGPQLAILWSRGRFDTCPLPYRVAAYERFGPIGGESVSCRFRTTPDSNGSALRADVWYICDGRVAGRMEGLECAGSNELNRITGKALTLR